LPKSSGLPRYLPGHGDHVTPGTRMVDSLVMPVPRSNSSAALIKTAFADASGPSHTVTAGPDEATSGIFPQARKTTLSDANVTAAQRPAALAEPSGAAASIAAVSSTGQKMPRSLIKLPSYDGTGSLKTFLAKFHRMASYLSWSDVDKYYHLCASLKAAAG